VDARASATGLDSPCPGAEDVDGPEQHDCDVRSVAVRRQKITRDRFDQRSRLSSDRRSTWSCHLDQFSRREDDR
jgi:hypothetical protein